MKIKSAKTAPAKKAVTAKINRCAKTRAAKKAAEKKPTLKSVVFTVHADKGRTVYLAGEFNSWNPTAKKMTYDAKRGLYSCKIKLAAGTHQYKFVIDGTWCADPENANAIPNDQGTFNSLIDVK